MADYAPNFTARHKLIYRYEGDQHQCVTRWPSANAMLTNTGLADAFWTSFFSSTDDLRHETFEALSAEYAPADSNTFLPVSLPLSLSPGLITSASGNSTKIIHTIWAGRSVLGAKSRLMMFGLRWNTADSTTYTDFRVTNDENATVGTIAALILSSGQVGPDDEVLGQVYNRVSVKANDAWVTIRRQGG